MTAHTKLIPSASQTVGPYFRIGLQYMIDREVASLSPSDAIELRGKVIDRDGSPVPDALLEFWSAGDASMTAESGSHENGLPSGFRRVATDENGNYSATVMKPTPIQFAGGRTQAPHFLVLFFARGLLRHLLTRVYFANDSTNDADPVLLQVPAERRHTLIAQSGSSDGHIFHWNVTLQGKDETVFFAW